MARVYATPDQYAAMAEEAFDGDSDKLEKRLRAASIEVDQLTRGATYDVDVASLKPTDSEIIEAFAEATCAIVEYWEETGDHTGAEANAGAISIGSVTLGTTSSRSSDGPSDADRLGAKALSILREALVNAEPSY
jgi:hypothetical protein